MGGLVKASHHFFMVFVKIQTGLRNTCSTVKKSLTSPEIRLKLHCDDTWRYELSATITWNTSVPQIHKQKLRLSFTFLLY